MDTILNSYNLLSKAKENLKFKELRNSRFIFKNLKKKQKKELKKIKRISNLYKIGYLKVNKIFGKTLIKNKYLKQSETKLIQSINIVNLEFLKIKKDILNFSKKKKMNLKNDTFDITIQFLEKEIISQTIIGKNKFEEHYKKMKNLQRKKFEKQKRKLILKTKIKLGYFFIKSNIKNSFKVVNEIIKEKNLIKKKKNFVFKEFLLKFSFLIDVPDNFDKFLNLFSKKSREEQVEIIQRIRKSNSVKFNKKNISKIKRFYVLLLKYFKHLCINNSSSILDLDICIRGLFSLSHDIPVLAFRIARETLIKINILLEKRFSLFKGTMPSGYYLFYFKFVSKVFPISENSHPITISLILSIGFCLSYCSINGTRDIACGLFLCTLALHCQKESKRYIPEVLTFIENLLEIGIQFSERFMGYSFNLIKEKRVLFWQFKIGSNIWIDLSRYFFSSFRISLKAIFKDDECSGEQLLKQEFLLIQEISKLWVNLNSFEEISNHILSLLEKFQNIPKRLKFFFNDLIYVYSKKISFKPVSINVYPKLKNVVNLLPEYDSEFCSWRKDKNIYGYQKQLKQAQKKKKKERKNVVTKFKKNIENEFAKQREQKYFDKERRKLNQKKLWSEQERIQADSNLFSKKKNKS